MSTKASIFSYIGIFTSLWLGTFIMLVLPYYYLPFIPIILSPIFIGLSNLSSKKKLFYSLYPLVLFIVVYILFHHRTKTPREITVNSPGYYFIYYGVKGGKKLKNKSGYRILDFKSTPVIITSTKQTDIIPVSDSKHLYQKSDGSVERLVFYDHEAVLNSEKNDSTLYINFVHPSIGVKTSCINTGRNNFKKEGFFIGRRNDFLYIDSLYPLDELSKTINSQIEALCSDDK